VPDETASDIGLTHVALGVSDADASISFYSTYAGMQVVHRRRDDTTGASVVWMSNLTRPFVIVLVEEASRSGCLGGICHLGVGCATREEVVERASCARREGHQVLGPLDSGPPVGFWAFIVDPDGHNLEISYGQEVRLAVQTASLAEPSTSEPP
jgi:catechol 2,3-dioxygenase-like lactoylglutathione lyase family enzyme